MKKVISRNGVRRAVGPIVLTDKMESPLRSGMKVDVRPAYQPVKFAKPNGKIILHTLR